MQQHTNTTSALTLQGVLHPYDDITQQKLKILYARNFNNKLAVGWWVADRVQGYRHAQELQQQQVNIGLSDLNLL
jgi:hypothetical protein